MKQFKNQQCKPCEGGVDPLDRRQFEQYRDQVPGWALSGDGKSISRTFRFTDFTATMAFINALAALAEQQDHHPDFCAGYNYCEVRFTTHAIGGLSDNDLVCAAKTNALPESG